MESVIKDLQQSKEKAAAIVEAAQARRTQLLADTHKEAKKNIAGIQGQNKAALKDLESELKAENDEKERNLIQATSQIIAEQNEAGERHLPEIVDLLYKTVITVDE
jgi:gamma-glutamyl:cysteine ligase YbdK (ATP-grasp superfamily)